ncbi:MAG: sialidase family protein [Thermoguttaceae bacterium]
MRWSPKTRLWTEEKVRWGDHRDQIIFHEKHDGAWGQKVFLECSVVRAGQELLYADYWTQYATVSGRAPHGWECTLMVSADNGRSSTRRSTIATMSASDATAEPGLERNRAGELVCVMRRDFGTAKEMYLVHSNDRGCTWTPPQRLFEFGVLPRLLQLDNGVMVLSFGRPGIWLSFSLDGAHSWTEPKAVIAGDPKNNMKHSCGCTSLLATGQDSFLLAYSEFERPNAKGQPAKAILVRKITVDAAKDKKQ